MKRFALALLLACGAAAAAEPQLPLVKLHYRVEWSSMTIGEASFRLTRTGTDCYRYESQTTPTLLVRMIYGSPSERSDFCVQDGRVAARHFEFHNPHTESDSFTLDFDGRTHSVRDSQGRTRSIGDDPQDRLGLQQAVRLWLLQNKDKADPGTAAFTLVDQNHARSYQVRVTGREPVDTPAGRFDTLVVQRVNDKKKSSTFWIAPAKGYMPVKVEQSRDGKLELRMVLAP